MYTLSKNRFNRKKNIQEHWLLKLRKVGSYYESRELERKCLKMPPPEQKKNKHKTCGKRKHQKLLSTGNYFLDVPPEV